MININLNKETKKISLFIRKVLKTSGFKKVIIAWSGGVDSTTCLYLLTKVINPNNIYVLHLPYSISYLKELGIMNKELIIPGENIREISIKEIVYKLWLTMRHSGKRSHVRRGECASRIDSGQARMTERVRLGNIMARIRMIILYDFAKKSDALVCGTENKSEYLLGYYTRYGDEASDFEPIRHLYKTQIYQLAKYLGVPQKIINQKPTAGLWPGQTDEGEFGFSYEEADRVLGGTKDMGKEKIKKITDFIKKNEFKHKVPYFIK